MDTLIQRLEITADELEDKNLKPMAATVKEAIKALSDHSSNRQVDAMVSIQNYESVLSDLVEYAETEKQRESLELLIQLFKNKFKRNSSVMESVWRIEEVIYKWRNRC